MIAKKILMMIVFLFVIMPLVRGQVMYAGVDNVYYDANKNKIIVDNLQICNVGATSVSGIVEVQLRVRPLAWMPALSLPPSAQDVCDPAHPENVHRKFTALGGQCVTMDFELPYGVAGLMSGRVYDVWFLSASGCWAWDPAEGGGEAFTWIAPFYDGWYIKSLRAERCVEEWICKDANTKAYQKSDCTLTSEEYCPYGCENGECKPAPPPDVRIERISGPNRLVEGETTRYTVDFKNYGGQEATVLTEVCIYPEYWLRNWGMLAILPSVGTSTCCPQNKFCEARKVTVKGGETGSVTYTVTAQTKETLDACGAGSAWDTSQNFYAVAGIYTECGKGYTSESKMFVTIDYKPCDGDGKCEVGETPQNCPQDCDPDIYCGDEICNGDETCLHTPKQPTDCEKDCGVCGDMCEGITCSNYCENGVRYYGGRCVNGECIYTTERCLSGMCEGDVCANPPECPVCPPPTEWSPCIRGKQTRYVYYCDATTNYQCEIRMEEQTCEWCGNAVCGEGENSDNCPTDCPRIPWEIIIALVILGGGGFAFYRMGGVEWIRKKL